MIFITGDTHGARELERFTTSNFPEQKEMSKDDYLIIAGDFGLVWNGSAEEEYWRKYYAEKNFTTLFIDGNHENFDLLEAYPVESWNGGKVHFINDSVIHLMRGQVFDLQGVKIFTMGGARSMDKDLRKPGVSWWERELPSQNEYIEGLNNLERHDWQVDYVITHDCSERVFNALKVTMPFLSNTTHLRDFLDEVEERVAYKHWYFGHFHFDQNLDDRHTVLFKDILQIR